MSKLSKIVLPALTSLLLFSCNNGTNKPTSATPDSTTVAIEKNNEKADKIVYVNSDTLSEKYQYFIDIRAKLEAKVKKAQSDLQSKGQAFQREVAEYEKNAPTMSASDRQATEERLARKQQELGRLDQNASQSLAQDEATEFNNVYTAITDYLKKHAEEQGYTYVLTYSKSNPAVLYANEKFDITRQILDGLNAEYKKKNEAGKK